MDFNDFGDFLISGDEYNIHIRHRGCEWSDHINVSDIDPPETNLKWLMIQANVHWMEAHKDDS